MRDLLGKVNNLNMFIHPKYNESFEFMDDFQSINLAKKLLKEFIKTKYKSIVVIESGTSPLISIMKKLKEYKNVDFRLIQIKIPRDLNFNLYEWFETYLTKEELNVKLNEILHIGDNKIMDIENAKKAGLKTILFDGNTRKTINIIKKYYI